MEGGGGSVQKYQTRGHASLPLLQISQVRIISSSPDSTVWKVRDDGWNGRWMEGDRRCYDFIGNHPGLTSGVTAKVSPA